MAHRSSKDEKEDQSDRNTEDDGEKKGLACTQQIGSDRLADVETPLSAFPDAIYLFHYWNTP